MECLIADRPTTSTSRASRPRMRSAHLPAHIPVATKTTKPRAKSASKIVKHKPMVKGKGKGKKKQGKAAVVISSDSEVSSGEVNFPNLPPNKALNVQQGEQEGTRGPRRTRGTK